ncbi:MAG TPA: hypothetical protein VJ892_02895 [Candidatus Absconditabacterales bacterium]|nr:hypothetical protein [Candidatus Absconditabacterales bacterium]
MQLNQKIDNNEVNEQLSDKEKLQKVQGFVDEMRYLGATNLNKTITEGEYTLRMDSIVDDGGSNINISLEQKGKEVFVFTLKETSYLEEGKTRTTGVTTKINGKIMSYSGNILNNKGLYNNFDLLESAKEKQEIIKEMIEKDNEYKNTKYKLNFLEEEIK